MQQRERAFGNVDGEFQNDGMGGGDMIGIWHNSVHTSH